MKPDFRFQFSNKKKENENEKSNENFNVKYVVVGCCCCEVGFWIFLGALTNGKSNTWAFDDEFYGNNWVFLLHSFCYRIAIL